MTTKSSGFWQINRMVLYGMVLALLFVVAAIRFGNLGEKTREGTTVGRLHELRQAILLYYQDHNGVFPRELSTEGPFGRYLNKIPEVDSLHPQGGALNPQGAEVTYGTESPQGFGRGWYYNYESGQLFVNSVGLDTRGIPYSAY